MFDITKIKANAQAMLDGFAEKYGTPGITDIITGVEDTGITWDDHLERVMKRFLRNIVTLDFQSEDDIVNHIYHDMERLDDAAPGSFLEWLEHNPERVRFIKKALTEYDHCVEDEDLLDLAVKLEIDALCNLVYRHLTGKAVPKVCRIINGLLSYCLEVDGEVIPFSGSYNADYFEKLYKEMGYTVERVVDNTIHDFLKERYNQ